MVNISELEETLNGQVEAGILTDFEMRRIMARATGGAYLDSEQKEQYEGAQEYINNTLEVLNKLHIISPKRLDSTRKKMQRAVVKHILNDGSFGSDGTPDVSALEFWEA